MSIIPDEPLPKPPEHPVEDWRLPHEEMVKIVDGTVNTIQAQLKREREAKKP